MARSREDEFLDKYVSWDGKDFNTYIDTDYDVFENEDGSLKKGGKYYAARQEARPLLNPLRRVGMSENDMMYYAQKAGIRNVNSKNDIDAILTAWEQDGASMAQSMPMDDEQMPDTAPATSPTADGEPGATEMDVRRGINFALDNAVQDFYPDETAPVEAWAAENYPFFAPYNRSSADPFKGVQYFGPNDAVRNVPGGLGSFMGSRYGEDQPEYTDSTQVAEAPRPEGLITEEDRVAFDTRRFLENLASKFGLS